MLKKSGDGCWIRFLDRGIYLSIEVLYGRSRDYLLIIYISEYCDMRNLPAEYE